MRAPSSHAAILTLCQRLNDEEVLKDLNAKTVSNIAWGLARMHLHEDPTILHSLARRAVQKDVLSQFNAQGISNTLWAYAALGVRDTVLVAALADRALVHIADFSMQGMAMTVHALAKLEVGHDALMEAVAERAMQPNMLKVATAQVWSRACTTVF